MSIEEAVASAVEEQVEAAIGNLDMNGEIAQEVEVAISNYDFGHIVSNNIDYDDIRYSIEDDILSQVGSYIDADDFDLSNQVQSSVEHFIFEGCHDMDVAADHILMRGMGGSNDWFIPSKEEWRSRNEAIVTPLATKVAELEATVSRLLEVINLPEVKAPVHILSDTINNGELSLSIAQEVLDQIRQERYQTIRYMSKPELVAWATENGYDVDGMTVAQIHHVVL
tara:strand:+ start:2456 stop:3130 length:675 start_codon:yes stop_codon:yes gene_type:complete